MYIKISTKHNQNQNEIIKQNTRNNIRKLSIALTVLKKLTFVPVPSICLSSNCFIDLVPLSSLAKDGYISIHVL